MQNAECRIEVFPSEIIEMSPQSGHLHFALKKCHCVPGAMTFFLDITA